jgi:hypothetical protein
LVDQLSSLLSKAIITKERRMPIKVYKVADIIDGEVVFSETPRRSCRCPY